MRRLMLFIIACVLLPAATVDKLAVAVGRTVITELQIDEDLRVAAFLNSQPVVRDLDARRAAADRLIEQLMIHHEIELSRYPGPAEVELASYYQHIVDTMGGELKLREKLAEYQLSDQILKTHLAGQLTTIRFIEFRFRPDTNISDAEIEAAYRRQVSAREGLNPKPPVHILDATLREKIMQSLIEERTDAALDTWLGESRKQLNIVYLDSELR